MMIITDKKELQKYANEKRIWQGIPSIEVTKGGKIFVTFYSGGTKEQVGNYVLLYRSNNEGEFVTTPEAVVLPKKFSRCFDSCLWIDPLGRLWFTWSSAPDWAVHATICEQPDADELIWGEEKIIGHNVMMNKPIVLSTGEWLFPMAVWGPGVVAASDVASDEEHICGAYVYKTNDCGETFTPIGKVDMPKRSFDEHMILEKKDGSLAMYVRTFYGIGLSCSYDMGKTWIKGVDSGIKAPSTRFCIRRLKSGRICFINNDSEGERTNLTAMLSEDDGKTWKYKLLLDDRADVSYPDFKETEDGYIHIIYDRERGAFKTNMEEALSSAREILYAKITEDDIVAGKVKDEKSRLRVIVNKLSKYSGNDKNPYQENIYLSSKELAEKLLKMVDDEDIIKHLFDLFPVACVNLKNTKMLNIDSLIEKFIASEDKDTLVKIINILKYANEEKNTFGVVKWVMEYVDKNFAEEIKVSKLAEKVNCSAYHMCHEFKKYTGLTITEYKNSKRMACAKKMLINTDKKICDIALECGYADESYFCKIFIREESVTPGNYRKLLG